MRFLNKIIYCISRALRQLGYNFHEEADERVRAMKDAVHTVGGKIEFKIEQHPDGSWTAESVNIDGIITGGISTKELSSALKDAVFTYFRIPPYLCNDAVLRADNEPVILMQRVYV